MTAPPGAGAVLWLLAVLPYAVGWVLGCFKRRVVWLVAAVLTGYQARRGN